MGFLSKNNKINLRNEFKMLQRELGLDILYIRSNKYIKCSCYDSFYNSASAKCTKCFGTGHLASVEKFNVIYSTLKQYNKPPFTHTPVGVVSTDAVAIYMSYDKLPRDKDYILISSFNKDGLIQDIKTVLEITSINVMRGDNGRVEIYGCYCEERADLLSTIRKNILSLDSKDKKSLSKKGKITCQTMS